MNAPADYYVFQDLSVSYDQLFEPEDPFENLSTFLLQKTSRNRLSQRTGYTKRGANKRSQQNLNSSLRKSMRNKSEKDFNFSRHGSIVDEEE